MLKKQEKRERRHKRVRAKITGNQNRPRLSVFKSNKHIYLQLIDDGKGQTLFSASDTEIKGGSMNKTETAKKVGLLIGKKAKEKNIEAVVFDRGGYNYHGRVKAAAEGAREGGLKF